MLMFKRFRIFLSETGGHFLTSVKLKNIYNSTQNTAQSFGQFG